MSKPATNARHIFDRNACSLPARRRHDRGYTPASYLVIDKVPALIVYKVDGGTYVRPTSAAGKVLLLNRHTGQLIDRIDGVLLNPAFLERLIAHKRVRRTFEIIHAPSASVEAWSAPNLLRHSMGEVIVISIARIVKSRRVRRSHMRGGRTYRRTASE